MSCLNSQSFARRTFAWLLQKPYALLVIATLFWASNAIAGKLAVGEITPAMLVFLRWICAGAILYGLGARHFHRDFPVIRAHMGLLGALGAIGFTGFSLGLFTALHYTSAVNVAIEQSAIPMFVLTISFVVLRINPLLMQVVGLLMGMAGVVIAATQGAPMQLLSANVNRGDLIMIAAAFAYAVYSFSLRWRPSIHWMSFLIAAMIGASLAALPVLVWTMVRDGAVVPTLFGWAILAYVSIFPSIISQALFVRAVEAIGAGRASLFITLVPVFSALLAVAILGEALHLYHILALALVLGGIALAESQARRQP